ncbi:alpha/beta fold hydrolase [bacterium]|nr:alpha/beta fold hydrolase [bacterium]
MSDAAESESFVEVAPPTQAELNDPSLAPAQPGEGCPPPLAWVDVVREVGERRVPIEAAVNGKPVRAFSLGDGPTLYFLNGIGGTPDVFSLLIWLLRDEYRCVVLDYPSHARSIGDLTQSLLAVADAAGDEQFNLYATSFGSLVALQTLLDTPQRISHAVLQGPLVGLKLTSAERTAARLLSVAPGKMRRLPFYAAVVRNNHQRWFPPIDSTRWLFAEQDMGEPLIADVARRGRMLIGLDFSNRLSGIKTPTLVISSEGEAQRHRDAATLLDERLPNSQHEDIPNTGHFAFLTHPHRMANLVRPFLQRPRSLSSQ